MITVGPEPDSYLSSASNDVSESPINKRQIVVAEDEPMLVVAIPDDTDVMEALKKANILITVVISI